MINMNYLFNLVAPFVRRIFFTGFGLLSSSLGLLLVGIRTKFVGILLLILPYIYYKFMLVGSVWIFQSVLNIVLMDVKKLDMTVSYTFTEFGGWLAQCFRLPECFSLFFSAWGIKFLIGWIRR